MNFSFVSEQLGSIPGNQYEDRVILRFHRIETFLKITHKKTGTLTGKNEFEVIGLFFKDLTCIKCLTIGYPNNINPC